MPPPSRMPTLAERLQAVLPPKYRVEAEAAAGGMGVVFLARDLALDRRVAIKVLLPELASAAAVARSQREARILAGVLWNCRSGRLRAG